MSVPDGMWECPKCGDYVDNAEEICPRCGAAQKSDRDGDDRACGGGKLEKILRSGLSLSVRVDCMDCRRFRGDFEGEH